MKKDIRPSDILIFIIALILMVINISIYMNKILVPEQQNKEEQENTINETEKISEEEIEKREKEQRINMLKGLGERDRMELYFSEYITYVENGNYEKAYSLLYTDFKDNYFKTIEEYTNYVKEKYPKMISIQYNDIERQGDIYILFIGIKNAFNETESFEQNIVIRETNFDEYVLSFSV